MFSLLNLVDRAVVSISVLVENVGVSVRESTSFDVLTREPYMVALVYESSKGKSLSGSPIDALSLID